MFDVRRTKEGEFSVFFLSYRGGRFLNVNLPFLIDVVWRNQPSIDLGNEFSEAILFSRQKHYLVFTTTVEKTTLVFEWNRRKWVKGFSVLDYLFGKARTIAIKDVNGVVSKYTGEDGTVYALTEGGLYRVRDRRRRLKLIQRGWVVDGMSGEVGKNLVVKTPEDLTGLLRALDGMGDDMRMSRQYFGRKEDNEM